MKKINLSGLFVILACLLNANPALAVTCTPMTGADNLRLTNPAHSNLNNPVNVKFEVDGDTLRATFEVHNDSIHAKQTLGPGEYPYMFDVVELFVSVADPKSGGWPYYEFELSPYNQILDVEAKTAKNHISGVNVGVRTQVQLVDGGWIGEFDVPLKNIGWDGDISKISGNAYSIFGAAPNRSYWSRSIPNQPKANFHQPQFFKPFFVCQ